MSRSADRGRPRPSQAREDPEKAPGAIDVAARATKVLVLEATGPARGPRTGDLRIRACAHRSGGLIVHLTSPTARAGSGGAAASDDPGPTTVAQTSSLGQRIAATAQSQLGYRTDPSNTYCNKYSAVFDSGTADCGNSDLDEEWCADFAAWSWLKSGALVTYQFMSGDINSSAASFYEWGVRHGTWHAVGSGYAPRPGDVAVYGLDTGTLVASHVAVVIGYHSGKAGPDVVNGDGDMTGFSVVEIGTDQYKADGPGTVAYLSGYTSPTPAG